MAPTMANTIWSTTIDPSTFTRSHLEDITDEKHPVEITLLPTIKSTHKLSGEGWVEYDFTVPESGWYTLSASGGGDANDHDFFVDKLHVYGGFGGHIANSWFTAGVHALRVQRYTYPGFAAFDGFTVRRSTATLAESVRVDVVSKHLVLRKGERVDLDIHAGGLDSAVTLTTWVKEASTGATVATYTVPLKASATELTERLSIPCDREGQYYVSFGDGDKPLKPVNVREIQYLVVDTKAGAMTEGGELKKTLLRTIDCASTPPDFNGGVTNVVHAPFGSYRESGDRGYLQSPKDYNFFTYRLNVPKPQSAYLVEVDYPDDDYRTFCIAMMERSMMDYPPVGGVDSGGAYSLTHQMQSQSFIYYPRGTEVVVSLVNTQNGRKAAAAKIRLYSIDAPLPALKAPAAGGRSFGYWLEEGDRWATFYGAPDKSLSGYLVSMGRWAETARYMGLDTLHPTVNIYQNMLFPSTFFDGYFRPSGGPRDPRPLDIVRMLLLVCEKYQLKLMPEFHPSGNAYHLHDFDSQFPVVNGVAVQRVVNRDGGTGHSAVEPHYNPIYPANKAWYIGMLGEFADQYKDSSAMAGISLRVMGWVGEGHTGFPSLKWGYEDYTVHQFEKETGTKVPVSDSDPERFRKRYDWLVANSRDKWVAWRCDKITELYKDIRDRVRQANPQLLVVSPVHGENDVTYHDEKARFFDPAQLPQALRDAGYDMEKMAKVDGVVFLNSMCYYGRRSKDEIAEQAGRDTLVTPQSRSALVTPSGRTGFMFSNSYFEANSTIVPAKMGLEGVKPQGWVGVVNPAGRHYLERYAISMADGDASYMADGGEGYISGQPLLREFLAEYRQLPVERFTRRADASDPAAVWEHNDGKHFWFYAVNRERYRVKLGVNLTGDGAVVHLADGLSAATANNSLSLTLEPYQLLAFRAPATRSIASVTTTIPAADKQIVEGLYNWMRTLADNVASGKTGQSLSPGQKATVAIAATESWAAYKAGHYWQTRTLMESHDLWPIYNLIGDVPPSLVFYKAPPMPVDALSAGAILPLATVANGESPKLVASETADSQWIGNTLLATPATTLAVRLGAAVPGKYALAVGHISGGSYGPLDVSIGDTKVGTTNATGKVSHATSSRFAPVTLSAGDQQVLLSRVSKGETALSWITLKPSYREIAASEWSTVGPFPSPLEHYNIGKPFEKAYAPETRIDTATEVSVDDKALRWMGGTSADSYVDLFDKHHKVGEVVCYGVTYLYAPSERKAELAYDVDWWGKLWVNGEKLVDFAAGRPDKTPIGRYLVTATLKAGWNEVLIKVQSGSAGNGFKMSISDPGDLKIAATTPKELRAGAVR